MVRRLYFYGVALISFITSLAALAILLTTLASLWLETGLSAQMRYMREAIAGSGGALLVAVPIFLLHWGFVQRRVDAAERRSGLRKFFLYAASLVAVGYALWYAFELIQGLALLALGRPPHTVDIWPAIWLADVLVVAAATALHAYFHHVLVQDGDYGAENRAAGAIRRLYQTLVGLGGLWLVIFGVGGLIEALVQWVLNPADLEWQRVDIATGLAQALLGAVVLRLNWQRWRAITVQHPQEAQSVLRRVYLYVAVVAGALAVLAPAGLLLNELLIRLFGQEVWDITAWDAVATAVGFVPVGLVVWIWHWRYLEREAAAYGESRHGVTIRRVYYYAVAATGLTVLWFGAGDLVQALLDWLLALGRTVGGSDRIWVYPLANGLSLLAVGAPVWAYHWRTVESVARRDDRMGLEERASGPRKVYLYGVALAGALLILVYLAQVVYRLLLVLMGDSGSALLGAETAEAIARSAISAALWTVHVLAIRKDGQQGTDAPPDEDAAVSRAALVARIAQLEADLAAAQRDLAALDTASVVDTTLDATLDATLDDSGVRG
jgi:hypothetical protein